MMGILKIVPGSIIRKEQRRKQQHWHVFVGKHFRQNSNGIVLFYYL